MDYVLIAILGFTQVPEGGQLPDITQVETLQTEFASDVACDDALAWLGRLRNEDLESTRPLVVVHADCFYRGEQAQ